MRHNVREDLSAHTGGTLSWKRTDIGSFPGVQILFKGIASGNLAGTDGKNKAVRFGQSGS